MTSHRVPKLALRPSSHPLSSLLLALKGGGGGLFALIQAGLDDSHKPTPEFKRWCLNTKSHSYLFRQLVFFCPLLCPHFSYSCPSPSGCNHLCSTVGTFARVLFEPLQFPERMAQSHPGLQDLELLFSRLQAVVVLLEQCEFLASIDICNVTSPSFLASRLPVSHFHWTTSALEHVSALPGRETSAQGSHLVDDVPCYSSGELLPIFQFSSQSDGCHPLMLKGSIPVLHGPKVSPPPDPSTCVFSALSRCFPGCAHRSCSHTIVQRIWPSSPFLRDDARACLPLNVLLLAGYGLWSWNPIGPRVRFLPFGLPLTLYRLLFLGSTAPSSGLQGCHLAFGAYPFQVLPDLYNGILQCQPANSCFLHKPISSVLVGGLWPA